MQRHQASAECARMIASRADLNAWGRTAGRRFLRLALALMAVGTAGCSRNTGSFDVDEPAQAKWDNLMALVEFKPLPRQPEPTDPLLCPEIHILDGTSADRVYAPGSEQSNETVRYQFSIDNVARGCQVNGKQADMKIGVAGRVLLGPDGAPGTYPAPIRVAIIDLSSGNPVVSKLYQVPATVPDGQTEAPFTLVTDPFSLPKTANFAESYTIKVGFDSAGNGKKQPAAQTASSNSSTAPPDASASTPRRHHHRRGFSNPDNSGASTD
jgi:hypothetical protein